MPILVLTAVALAGSPALAQDVSLEPQLPQCLPQAEHGLVRLNVAPAGDYASVRVYFREQGSGEYYFLELQQQAEGSYWAVLPAPACGTDEVELYFTAGAAGTVAAQTAPVVLPVKDDDECRVELTEAQQRAAQNLVVGETAADQDGERVAGFCCDGIVSRFNVAGTMSRDDVCSKELMAGVGRCDCAAVADNRKKLIPWIVLGAGGGGIIAIREGDDKEASVARP